MRIDKNSRLYIRNKTRTFNVQPKPSTFPSVQI